MNIVTRIESIRAREHEATVELIAALIECDRTDAHLEFGYSGIWDLLTRHLHYSNAAASRRYKAMKCARAHPEVLRMLRKHQVNLSTLAMVEATLAKSEEPRALLRTMVGKSQRQVEELLARRHPVPRRKEVVRRQVVKPLAETPPLLVATSAAEPPSGPRRNIVVGPPKSVSQPAVPHEEPSSAAEVEERVHLSFSVSGDTFERFERAKTILSRKLPKGVTLEEAFEEFVEFYLKHKAPKQRKKPSRESNSRHIPVATRDEVFLRDESRCTFTGPAGQRCESRHDLEVDHIQPYALGGTHAVENLRVLCAKHNRLRAKQTFGEFRGGTEERSSVPQRKSMETRGSG